MKRAMLAAALAAMISGCATTSPPQHAEYEITWKDMPTQDVTHQIRIDSRGLAIHERIKRHVWHKSRGGGPAETIYETEGITVVVPTLPKERARLATYIQAIPAPATEPENTFEADLLYEITLQDGPQTRRLPHSKRTIDTDRVIKGLDDEVDRVAQGSLASAIQIQTEAEWSASKGNTERAVYSYRMAIDLFGHWFGERMWRSEHIAIIDEPFDRDPAIVQAVEQKQWKEALEACRKKWNDLTSPLLKVTWDGMTATVTFLDRPNWPL